jgi:hypothetical protein
MDAEAGPLLLVCGARRTGTTLLAAILSADGSTPPFPGEAQLLPKWLESYRWAGDQFAIRALPFFRDAADLRAFYRRFLGSFLAHCRGRFGAGCALVLKAPELSLYFAEARDLFPAARMLVTIRDPRDQVASEWRVVEKRRGGEDDLRILRERDFETLAWSYVRYYEPVLAVLERSSEGILVVRYEQLVTRTRDAIAWLEEFTGLDLGGFEARAPWPRVADTYWAYGTSPSDTPHYGKAIEPGRVGSYGESMSDEEARRVQAICAGVMDRLGRFVAGH